MGTPENNTDVLSMEELLKIAEEAASADAPMDDPVLAEAVAEMPVDSPIIPDIPIAEAETPAAEEIPAETTDAPVGEEPPSEEEPAADTADPNMAMTDNAVDAIVANMLGDIPEDFPMEEPAADADTLIAEDAAIDEEPIPAEEPISAEEPVMPEEAPAIEIPASDGAKLLTPMNDDPAHCVLCVRVDPAEVGLDIPEGSKMMISDNTVIFPENGALLTQDLLTGAKDRSELNDSVLAAFSISMNHFATQNETYTLHSLLFSWLLKKLLTVSEDPGAAQKINDTLSFLGCPFRYTTEGFTDDAGQILTAAEVFLRLSAQRI